MVKTTPQPADLSPIEQRILALCKRLQIEFARDGEPRLNMWVRIGVELAFQQRELKPGRPRGRPRSDHIAPTDMKILEATETAAKELNLDPNWTLNRYVKILEKEGVLPVAERTTHRKRLKRAKARRDEDRRKKARMLGALLMKRDK
jgi:hypothetical protein